MGRGLAAALVAAALPLAAATERSFTLVATDGVAAPGQRTLRVTKGDAVVVHITSNRPGEAHLHGYRLAAKVVPGQAATLKFTAHATGRYRIEWHADGAPATGHHGPPLSTLEVMPR